MNIHMQLKRRWCALHITLLLILLFATVPVIWVIKTKLTSQEDIESFFKTRTNNIPQVKGKDKRKPKGCCSLKPTRPRLTDPLDHWLITFALYLNSSLHFHCFTIESFSQRDLDYIDLHVNTQGCLRLDRGRRGSNPDTSRHYTLRSLKPVEWSHSFKKLSRHRWTSLFVWRCTLTHK